MDKFWMVWNDNGGMPRHKHDSLKSAGLEAERLAMANMGQRFFVLEALETVKCEMPIIKEQLYDPGPF